MKLQHMNIFGRIKFDELVKPACMPAHLHVFVIQRNIWSYYKLWTKDVKLAWRCTQNLWLGGITSKRFTAYMPPSFAFAITFSGFNGGTDLLSEAIVH